MIDPKDGLIELIIAAELPLPVPVRPWARLNEKGCEGIEGSPSTASVNTSRP